jgi:hypothetical protein
MIGYLATYNGYYSSPSLNDTLKVGETYEVLNTEAFYKDNKVFGNGSLWTNGFHFCLDIKNTIHYHSILNPEFKIFEVEALGKIIHKYTNSATNKIKIIREVSRSELSWAKWNDKGQLSYLECEDYYGEHDELICNIEYDEKGNAHSNENFIIRYNYIYNNFARLIDSLPKFTKYNVFGKDIRRTINERIQI